MVDSINRIICKTSKLVDYFTEDGLIKQIGLTKEYWNRVIIKEIVDNALDAIEPLNNKEVHIIQSDSSLGIYDNGNGLSCEIIKSIYDFNLVLVRKCVGKTILPLNGLFLYLYCYGNNLRLSPSILPPSAA